VIIVAAVALVTVLCAGFAVNRIMPPGEPPDEPPSIIVRAGDVEIDWMVGKNKWNGVAYDRLSSFPMLMTEKTIDDLVYIPNGEDITIYFENHNDFPGSFVLTEFILREDGSYKYNINGMDYDDGIFTYRDPFGEYLRSFSITIKSNYATLASSFSGDYLPGNTIKGYHLVCTWDGNECEYSFIIRGDPAMTMTHEQTEETPPYGYDPPPTDYKPRKWVDFYLNDDLPWTETYDLMLDEFPGVLFSWTSEKVTVTEVGETKDLFWGMPVWNVYLADLNGDGLPELCATNGFGSGIYSQAIIVHDYANSQQYILHDRAAYDYTLSLENGYLVVTQTRSHMKPGSEEITGVGSLEIINGELVVFGIDRTLPEADPQAVTSPTPEPSPKQSDELYFLNSVDGVAFQSVAYSAARSLLSADANELSTYLADPAEAVNITNGLSNVYDEVEYMFIVFDKNSIKSENEINASYRYLLNGEDSVWYVSMELIKIDNVWKVRFIGIEK